MWHFFLLLISKIKKAEGDLDKKLDKVTTVTTYPKVYVKDQTGDQIMINAIHTNSDPYSLARRNGNGQIYTADPVEPTHASNKQSTEQAINAVFSLVGTELTITLY